MPAPEGNSNARKPDEERASSWLKLRVKPSDKSNWVKQAQKEGMSLSAWVMQKLNS